MTASPARSTPPTPDLIFETLMAYQRSAALRAAIELDLFHAIGEGAHDVQSLARTCSASERGIRILCDYLTVIGLLTKTDGRYHHSSTSEVFLDPRSPACIASVSRFLTDPALREPFQHLTEIVRTGRTVLAGQGSVEPENPLWVEFARSMTPLMAPMAAPLARVVLEGLEEPMRVLDIAAGHGLFGIEVAKQSPQSRVVAVDWPAVLELAAANARAAGVKDRYDLLPGSAFEVDFGDSYDIALLTNFLHHFDQSTCTRLLEKVRAALTPRGRAAALEFVPNEDRVSPPLPASFSLGMLAATPGGEAYTFNELKNMYHAAGFKRVTAQPIPHMPQTIVVGHLF